MIYFITGMLGGIALTICVVACLIAWWLKDYRPMGY